MEVATRFLRPTDVDEVSQLFKEIASHPGGFAREAEEVTLEYISDVLDKTLVDGLGIGAFEKATGRLIAFIVAKKPGPKVFDHVLSDLLIGVHPSFQSKGIGRRVFIDFLEHIQSSRPDVLRVELVVRESNQKAIAFYESIGFRAEGVFEKRIRNSNGQFESDIPMGWFKPGI